MKDFRLTISQAGADNRFSYHVTLYYGRNNGHMSDLGEYESPELCFRHAMAFAKMRPVFHKMVTNISARNLEVFRMYAVDGLEYQEIANRLGIVRPRVAYHIYKVRDALQAKTVQHAVFLATVAGLIP